MILPALIVALVFTGGPALPVTCDPNLRGEGILGESYGEVYPDGTLIAMRIGLATEVCGGLTYAAASTPQRVQIRTLNRALLVDWPDWTMYETDALMVALHEANHAGMRSGNECDVERETLAGFPRFACRYFTVGNWPEARDEAVTFDSFLPKVYHTGC